MTSQATTDSSPKFTTVTVPDELSSQEIKAYREAILKYRHYLLQETHSLIEFFTTKTFEELLLLSVELNIDQFCMMRDEQHMVPAIRITSISASNVNEFAFKFKHSLFELIHNSLTESKPDEVEAKVKLTKKLIESNLSNFALQIKEKLDELQKIAVKKPVENELLRL